jgi:hypothetical protein
MDAWDSRKFRAAEGRTGVELEVTSLGSETFRDSAVDGRDRER